MYQPVDPSQVKHGLTRRRRFFVLTFVAVLFILLVFGGLRHVMSPRFENVLESDERAPEIFPAGPARNRVAVASEFPLHFDVHLAAARTVRDVLGEVANIQVFAYTPLRFGFQEVVDSLDLYKGEIQSPDAFMSAINSNTLYPTEPGKMIDVVIFGTCEIDMRKWSDELLAAWDARPSDQKFQVVCIVHHFRDTAWQAHITPWAARGAIRLMPIASHVGRAFRTRFKELADSNDPQFYNAMYEYIDIDVHAPVLNLPEYGTRRNRTKLSHAVIQGSFSQAARDFEHIFIELLHELKHDPTMWGYKPLSYDRDMYEPLDADGNADEPFTLHLIGDGTLDVPKALQNVVVIHADVSYVDFYTLMQSMDVVLPAFASNDYYLYQASSTVAMAIQCDVPILATHRASAAYGYIDDNRVRIPRPQALREIPALGALRRGSFAPPPHVPEGAPADETLRGLHIDTHVYAEEFLADVDAMLQTGWRRTPRQFRAFKNELWAQNRNTIRRVLHGLKGTI